MKLETDLSTKLKEACCFTNRRMHNFSKYSCSYFGTKFDWAIFSSHMDYRAWPLFHCMKNFSIAEESGIVKKIGLVESAEHKMILANLKLSRFETCSEKYRQHSQEWKLDQPRWCKALLHILYSYEESLAGFMGCQSVGLSHSLTTRFFLVSKVQAVFDAPK